MKKRLTWGLVFIGIAFSAIRLAKAAQTEAAVQRREDAARIERALLKGKIVIR